MIPLNLLIDRIQAKLDAITVPSHIDNTEYLFKVFANEGEYFKPTRNANTVTKYINCVASIIGDEKTGINEATMTVSATIKLDILIPDATIEYEGVSFGNAVINAINSAFMIPTSEIEQENGIVYNIVGVYSSVTPGLKEIRPAVGESLTATAYIDFVVSTSGYSSSNVKIYLLSPLVGGGMSETQIYYSRLDISRAATQESNISSSQADGVSKSVNVSTALVVSIIKPDRLDLLDLRIGRYLLGFPIAPLDVKIEFPVGYDGGGRLVAGSEAFKMIFREACKGAEGLDVPSNTCTLVESLEV